MNVTKEVERFCRAYENALACEWKGGWASITNHLKRRQQRGHLSQSATVFPPDVPERYFASTKGYKLIGKLSELIL